jgi:hypothetical protein
MSLRLPTLKVAISSAAMIFHKFDRQMPMAFAAS